MGDLIYITLVNFQLICTSKIIKTHLTSKQILKFNALDSYFIIHRIEITNSLARKVEKAESVFEKFQIYSIITIIYFRKSQLPFDRCFQQDI